MVKLGVTRRRGRSRQTETNRRKEILQPQRTIKINRKKKKRSMTTEKDARGSKAKRDPKRWTGEQEGHYHKKERVRNVGKRYPLFIV